MSYKAPCDRCTTRFSDKYGHNINAGIDSSFTNDPAHRGSLTPSELDYIRQTNSFKQAMQLQDEDSRKLAAKMKQISGN